MRGYVKSNKGYDDNIFEEKKIKEAMQKRKAGRKVPTSIALDAEFFLQLKEEAEARGIPYQVLLRMFIVEGLRNLKKHVKIHWNK